MRSMTLLSRCWRRALALDQDINPSIVINLTCQPNNALQYFHGIAGFPIVVNANAGYRVSMFRSRHNYGPAFCDSEQFVLTEREQFRDKIMTKLQKYVATVRRTEKW